jgi:hypothetical protein
MRSLIMLLIDLIWLVAALGLLVWGSLPLFKQRGGWKRGVGFVAAGALLMAARYVGALWRVLHECVGG